MNSPSSNNNLRVPPNSIEAEESVLGSVLLDNHAINTTLEILSSEDFYSGSNRAIFQAMEQLNDKGDAIDIVTLSEQLKLNSTFDESGGLENLSRLAGLVPSSGNISYYAKLVKEMSVRRKMIHEASQIVGEAFQLNSDVGEFLDQAEQKILAVSDQRIGTSFTAAGDIVQESIKTIEKMYDQKNPITGIPSGFHDIDRLTSGLQGSDLIIVAARPSMGKTALAMSICQWVSIHDKSPAAIFSLEMSKEQLILRALCSEGRVNNSKVRNGNLGEHDFPQLVDAASRIAEAPLYIDDTPALTVTEMRAKARRLHKENPLSLIVVDYLQLMRSPLYSSKNREQEISDISRSLKALAKELNVPVLALSQLNRSVESRTDKRPMMSDLRESGAIEQDADLIMFIYRDEVYNPDTVDRGVAEILLAKHRSGPTGKVRLAFFPEFTRFDNLEERDDIIETTGLQSEVEVEELDPNIF